MADSQIDPARLDGDALTQWYLRSPDHVEQERQDAATQRYRDFFEGNGGAAQDPGIDTGFQAPTQDIDPEVSWTQVGRNRWRSVSSASSSPSSNLGTEDSAFSGGGAFERSDGGSGADGETHTAVGQFRPRARVAPVPAPSPAVSALPAAPGAQGSTYRSPASPPAPASASPLFGGFTHNPFTAVADAFHGWQHGPKMQRPNLAESFIPVVGPAWEAAADLQDGNYGGAAFNGVMAAADALPIGVAAKGLKAASKGVTVFKDGSLTAGAAASRLRAWGIAKKGEEIHHTVALNGIKRNEQNWRNHYALLKVLPEEIHQRLTRSWNGKPQFDPIRRIWHGTTDWQKAIPTGIAGYAADAWENLTHPFGSTPPNGPGSNGRP